MLYTNYGARESWLPFNMKHQFGLGTNWTYQLLTPKAFFTQLIILAKLVRHIIIRRYIQSRSCKSIDTDIKMICLLIYQNLLFKKKLQKKIIVICSCFYLSWKKNQINYFVYCINTLRKWVQFQCDSHQYMINL